VFFNRELWCFEGELLIKIPWIEPGIRFVTDPCIDEERNGDSRGDLYIVRCF
jgi:hypothetical protein